MPRSCVLAMNCNLTVPWDVGHKLSARSPLYGAWQQSSVPHVCVIGHRARLRTTRACVRTMGRAGISKYGAHWRQYALAPPAL